MVTSKTAEERLEELGLVLPKPAGAVANYVPWAIAGNMLYTSGQLPWIDGDLKFKGKIGKDLTAEQGYQACRLSTLNAIAQLKAELGDLSKVRRILRLEGFVHCGPGFREHPQVLNGASELLNAVFGDRGRHTRTAVGIHEMPMNSPVQLVVWAEVD